MRIVSQDKMRDINYEAINLTVRKNVDTEIKGCHEIFEIMVEENYCILAKYKTKERALEVMQEIRTAYIRNEMTKYIISAGDKVDNSDEIAQKIINTYGYYHMPKE